MYISRNPAKSRPLSTNVKRLMRLSRAAPRNGNVVREKRHFTAKDLACCGKQGDLFMEAASMGFSMKDFAPLFMTSQLAGVFDASFSSSAVMENENLANLLQIPVLLKSPQLIVETLYWIDDIISKSSEGENKSLVLTEAYKAEKLKLPQALAELPAEPNRNVDDLAYAYWLGFIRPCEEGARDAVRWCIVREDKRKSRQITCTIFIEKLREMMGWDDLYRYRLQGMRIDHDGEQLYLFDLSSNECFLPQKRDPDTGKLIRPKPILPAEWRETFGMDVKEHEASTQVDLTQGFVSADLSQQEEELPLITAQIE